MATTRKRNDPQVRTIEEALSAYRRAHPRSTVAVKRQNPVAIRIRVVDPDFAGTNRLDREPEVWKILKNLPDDVFQNITMLLLLTPDEARTSLANLEFDDPLPSAL